MTTVEMLVRDLESIEEIRKHYTSFPVHDSPVHDSLVKAQNALFREGVRVTKTARVSKVNKDPKQLTKEEQAKAREPYGKIQAIKMYRERLSVGLLEAKNAVENWMRKNLGFCWWGKGFSSDYQYQA